VVASDDRVIIDRSLHVNGSVDVAVSNDCSGCHGGSVTAAPPRDLSGSTSPRDRGVGAHARHVFGSNFSRPVACSECHVVPESVFEPGHVDSALPAELRFSGVAVAHGAEPVFDGVRCSDSYCHGAVLSEGDPSGGSNTAPVWTAVGEQQAVCGSCHSLPPPPPHIQTTLSCSTCHLNITPSFTFIDPTLHVNGSVD
jgi:predicted CxxxxCH...CXXCH cytochrome family protein